MYEYRVIDIREQQGRTPSPRNRPGRFELEEQLNEAAREGYRLVFLLGEQGNPRAATQLLIMERKAL